MARVRAQADGKAYASEATTSVGGKHPKMCDEAGVPEFKESGPGGKPDTPNGAEFSNLDLDNKMQIEVIAKRNLDVDDN